MVDWLGGLYEWVRQGDPHAAYVVCFPGYRPELVRELARETDSVHLDFRREKLAPLGWAAATLPPESLTDAVLDAILEQEPTARVAAETLVSTGLVVMSGEITTGVTHDYAKIAPDGTVTGVSGRFSLTDAAKKATMRIRNLPQGGPAMKQYVIALDQGTTSSRAIPGDSPSDRAASSSVSAR